MENQQNYNNCNNCNSMGENNNSQQGNAQGTTGEPEYTSHGNGNMRPVIQRNVALCIIFSVITCGIYSLYWLVVLNNDINELAGERNDTSGGKVLLFSIITFGIYLFYWMYKSGGKIDRIKGNPNGNSGVLYIVLTFLGLGIVSYAIMQDIINKNAVR